MHLPTRFSAVVLALLIAAPVLGLASGADADSPCEGFVRVPGLGPTCPEADGLHRILLADGTSVLTHGGDPVGAAFADPLVSTAASVPPVCVSDPAFEPHGHVLYTIPSDQPSRFATLETSIRSLVEQANGILLQDSSERGVPVTYRMRCAGGLVEVTEVKLLTASDADDFSTIMNDLRVLGYDSKRAKYWIWHDGTIDCNCGGIGTLYLDDRNSGTNSNNKGPSYGATFGYLGSSGDRIMMHENGHNLGAVQNGAPRSSGAGHCNDGLDIMCYGDGGPTSAYTSSACRDRQRFDCNHDTYFDTAPTGTEWLVSHWNLGSPLNRFVSGCFYATGTLVGGLNGVDVEGVSATTVAIPPACAGHRFALYGEADALIDDFNVCWYSSAGVQLGCKVQRYHDVGYVPDGTASARITYALGAAGQWTLSIL